MDPARARSLGLALALCAAACTSHRPERDHGEHASCPGVELAPGLFKRIQGTWTVRHTHYRRGAKPPRLRQVGALTIEGCRYTFSADEEAKLGDLRRWFPIVDRPTGVVEIIGEPPPNLGAYFYLDLGVIRLHGDPEPPLKSEVEGVNDSIELAIRERLQEGEYLLMKVTDEALPTHTLSIERGKETARGDEYPGGFDPEEPGIDWEARRREVDAALPRWREEAAARAAAPPASPR